jgi:hypothetical protein
LKFKKTLPENQTQIARLDSHGERFGVAVVDSTVFRDKAKANHAIFHLSKNVFEDCGVALMTPRAKPPYYENYGSEGAKAILTEIWKEFGGFTSLHWEPCRLP